YAAADIAIGQARRLRIGLLGARTLSFLVGPLIAAGPARGLVVEVVEAPYDQLAPFAYGALDPFGAAALDAVVVVLDAASLGAGDDAGLVDALADRVKALGSRAIVATIPAPAAIAASGDLVTAASARRRIDAINDHIVAGASAGRWLVWDMAGLA